MVEAAGVEPKILPKISNNFKHYKITRGYARDT